MGLALTSYKAQGPNNHNHPQDWLEWIIYGQKCIGIWMTDTQSSVQPDMSCTFVKTSNISFLVIYGLRERQSQPLNYMHPQSLIILRALNTFSPHIWGEFFSFCTVLLPRILFPISLQISSSFLLFKHFFHLVSGKPWVGGGEENQAWVL